jgi:hypothetical protein
MRLALGLLCVASAFSQNPRHVIATHPRMLLNDTITDTWEPAKTRLTAVTQRICGNSACSIAGSSATAFSDWGTMKAILSGSPSYSFAHDEGLTINAQAWSFAYLLYHKLGNDTAANPYAAAMYTYITTEVNQSGGITKHVTAIDTDSSGNPTVTFSAPHGITLGTPGSVNLFLGGASLAHDGLMGSTQVWSVPTSTTVVTSNLGVGLANLHVTDSGMLANTNLGYGADQVGTAATKMIAMAYYYDWCYDWLVANGHDATILDNLKLGYWMITLSRNSSQFNNGIRESDFHNYATWPESGVMEIGLSLALDDPLGYTILDEGAGYFWEGITVRPDINVATTYTYNIKTSIDVLTGGAGNWEGPQYWRNGYIRLNRAMEAFDSATGRLNNIWGTQFSTGKQAGLYKMFTYGPHGYYPTGTGDAGIANGPSGRDNIGISIVNDRFPDSHFKWYMANNGAGWNNGSDGTGLLYKLGFYPYLGSNDPGSHDLTDLPLSAQFGTDVIIRTGWTDTDTYLWITGSLPGTTHRPWNAGDWGMYRSQWLAVPSPYTSVIGASYGAWHKVTIGGNTLGVQDPSSCWSENGTCNQDHFGGTAYIQGQRDTQRTFNPPLASGWQQLHMWSASMLSGSPYNEVLALTMPTFTNGWSGVEYVKLDLSKAYTNNYGSGSNSTAAPTANLTSNVAGAVTRELVHFQPVSGGVDVTVLFSRVTSANSAFTKSDIIHTVSPMQNFVSGSWSTPSVGDSTATAPTALRTDNSTARMYVIPLLPASPKARTVGGENSPLVITDCTVAANAVCTTASPHGLSIGDTMALAMGSRSAAWGELELQKNTDAPAITTVGSVPTSTTFTVGFDSSALPSFASTYSSGSGAPSGSCTNGRVYYNTINGQPYLCQGAVWSTSGTYGAYGAPVIEYIPNQSFDAKIDIWNHNAFNMYDRFPLTNPGTVVGNIPMWRVEIQPPSAATTDYFLNVVVPTTTSDSTPNTSLISATGWSGAQIVAASITYTAMFPLSSSAQSSVSYTSTHSGTGKHVVTGLSASSYIVTQGGSSIGRVPSDAAGTISFTETGGGAFSISDAGPSTGIFPMPSGFRRN